MEEQGTVPCSLNAERSVTLLKSVAQPVKTETMSHQGTDEVATKFAVPRPADASTPLDRSDIHEDRTRTLEQHVPRVSIMQRQAMTSELSRDAGRHDRGFSQKRHRPLRRIAHHGHSVDLDDEVVAIYSNVGLAEPNQSSFEQSLEGRRHE